MAKKFIKIDKYSKIILAKRKKERSLIKIPEPVKEEEYNGMGCDVCNKEIKNGCRTKGYISKVVAGMYYDICSKKCLKIFNKKPNYKLAYEILMEYFDYLPDEDKPFIDKELKKCGL